MKTCVIRSGMPGARKEGMSDITWKLVEERQKLQGKLESFKTRNQKLTAAQNYKKKNREVERSCKKYKIEKKNYSTALQAERAAEMTVIKKVHKTTNIFCGKKNIQNMGSKVNQLRTRVAQS